MTSLLDKVLNKISMYRLVSIALTLLWSNSLAASALGLLEYDYRALALSGIILLISTTASNLLLGRLYGIRTHNESSYITALILLFILPPTLELSGLLALALVGSIASATKYILVRHGRHIFNPAAAAALIASLAGLAHATWWVGTPTLLPLSLILVLLILYKTGRLVMGAIFLIIASSGVLLLLMSYGTPIGEAVPLLASWPLLFFVGFMLSEPLTLPPKRWQQYAEAALVSVIFALPLQTPQVALNPTAALLIGNLFAAAISHRRRIALTLAGVAPLTPTTYEYTFKPHTPLPYRPGQYIEITVPHSRKDSRGVRRAFSITSAPDNTLLALGVKHTTPSSSFKRALHDLPINSVIQSTGIGGDFTLPASPSVPLLFLAGGIGITPFISHLASLRSDTSPRDITLIYSVSHPDEIAYAPALQEARVQVIIVTPYPVKDQVEGWQYINSPQLEQDQLFNLVGNIQARHTYIAGPPAMVRTMRKHLRRLGVPHIQTDHFTGY